MTTSLYPLWLGWATPVCLCDKAKRIRDKGLRELLYVLFTQFGYQACFDRSVSWRFGEDTQWYGGNISYQEWVPPVMGRIKVFNRAWADPAQEIQGLPALSLVRMRVRHQMAAVRLLRPLVCH